LHAGQDLGHVLAPYLPFQLKLGVELLKRLGGAVHGSLFPRDPNLPVPVVDADSERIADRAQMLVARPKQRKNPLRVGKRYGRFGHSMSAATGRRTRPRGQNTVEVYQSLNRAHQRHCHPQRKSLSINSL
jgi:hypothetical protein